MKNTETPHAIIAALRARLALTDEEVAALIEVASANSDIMGGDEWDDDAFHDWLTDEVWNYVSPTMRRIKRVQKAAGWTFDE